MIGSISTPAPLFPKPNAIYLSDLPPIAFGQLLFELFQGQLGEIPSDLETVVSALLDARTRFGGNESDPRNFSPLPVGTRRQRAFP